MKRRGIDKNKLLICFLLPYIAILLIPLAIGMVIYERTLRVMENEATKANLTLLEQTKEILDRRLSEMDAIMQQIVTDPKVLQFQYVKHPFAGATTYRILETRKGLYDYSLSSLP